MKNRRVPWTLYDVWQAIAVIIFLALISFFIRNQIVISKEGIIPLPKSVISFLTTLLIYGVLVFLVWSLVIRKYSASFKDLGLRSFKVWHILVISVVWLVVIKVLSYVYSFLIILFGYNPPVELIEKVPRLFGTSYLGIVLAVVMTGIIAPVVEEIFFRGFIYPPLRKRFGVSGGIILSAVIFGLFHLETWVIIPIMIIGVVLAYLYETEDSLGPPIMVHALNNLLSLVIVYLYVR